MDQLKRDISINPGYVQYRTICGLSGSAQQTASVFVFYSSWPCTPALKTHKNQIRSLRCVVVSVLQCVSDTHGLIMLYHVLKWFSSPIISCYFTHHPTTCLHPEAQRDRSLYKHVAHCHWYKYTVQTSSQWVFAIFLKSLFLQFFFFF